MTDAVTTNAAVIAMRSTSVRRKASSGDICFVVPANAGTHNHGFSFVRKCRAMAS